MRIEQLQYLVDLAQSGSLSKTAQNFYITQQGLGNALKKLEQEFSTQLYVRNNSGVTLTPMGQYFVQRGSEILAIYQDLCEQASKTCLSTLDCALSIITHPRIFQYILPTIITTFSTHCPHVKIRIIEEAHREFWYQADYEHDFDFGLAAIGNMMYDSPTFQERFAENHLQTTRLYSDDLIVCVHRSSPYKNKPYLTDQEVAELPIISFGLNSNKECIGCDSANLFTSGNIETHRYLITQGLAASVMTRFEYHKAFGEDSQFIAVPMQNKKIVFALIHSDQKLLTMAAEHFVSLLKAFPYH